MTDLSECIDAVATHRDRMAFAVLYIYYAPRLKHYFQRHRLAAGAAEDLAQETLLRVWDKASYFDARLGAPSSWIFTIARNLRVSGARLASGPFRGVPPVPAEDVMPPDAILEVADREARLRQALSRLESEHVDLLKLSFFEGKSHLQIAAERNLPLGTVKSHLRRTLLRLREALAERS